MKMSYSQFTNPSEPAFGVGAVVPSSEKQELKKMAYRRRLLGFAITEIVLGMICMALGSTLLGLLNGSYRSYQDYDYSGENPPTYAFTYGEGLWCGVWVIVAGALGVHAAKQSVSYCMVICHMSFSIVGAAFCGVLFIIGFIGTKQAYAPVANLGIVNVFVVYCIQCFSAFSAMLFLILSASYTCALLGWCEKDYNQSSCCCGPYPNSSTLIYGGQAMLTQQSQPGNAPVMIAPQQQHFATGQGAIDAGQPVHLHQIQQPAYGGQGIIYMQQTAAAPYQGVPTSGHQAYAVPILQPKIPSNEPQTATSLPAAGVEVPATEVVQPIQTISNEMTANQQQLQQS